MRTRRKDDVFLALIFASTLALASTSRHSKYELITISKNTSAGSGYHVGGTVWNPELCRPGGKLTRPPVVLSSHQIYPCAHPDSVQQTLQWQNGRHLGLRSRLICAYTRAPRIFCNAATRTTTSPRLHRCYSLDTFRSMRTLRWIFSEQSC